MEGGGAKGIGDVIGSMKAPGCGTKTQVKMLSSRYAEHKLCEADVQWQFLVGVDIIDMYHMRLNSYLEDNRFLDVNGDYMYLAYDELLFKWISAKERKGDANDEEEEGREGEEDFFEVFEEDDVVEGDSEEEDGGEGGVEEDESCLSPVKRMDCALTFVEKAFLGSLRREGFPLPPGSTEEEMLSAMRKESELFLQSKMKAHRNVGAHLLSRSLEQVEWTRRCCEESCTLNHRRVWALRDALVPSVSNAKLERLLTIVEFFRPDAHMPPLLSPYKTIWSIQLFFFKTVMEKTHGARKKQALKNAQRQQHMRQRRAQRKTQDGASSSSSHGLPDVPRV